MNNQASILLQFLAMLVFTLLLAGCGLPVDSGSQDQTQSPSSAASPDPNQPISNQDPTPPPLTICQEELDVTKRVVVVRIMESYPPQYVVQDEGGTEYFLRPTAATSITLPGGRTGDIDLLYESSSKQWEVTGDWIVYCDQPVGDIQNATITVLP